MAECPSCGELNKDREYCDDWDLCEQCRAEIMKFIEANKKEMRVRVVKNDR